MFVLNALRSVLGFMIGYTLSHFVTTVLKITAKTSDNRAMSIFLDIAVVVTSWFVSSMITDKVMEYVNQKFDDVIDRFHALKK